MNILFLSPSIPDSFSRIRSLNLIKALSKKHSLHLLAFFEDDSELKKIPAVKKFFSSIETVQLPKWQSYLNCAANLLSFSRLPFRVSYFYSRKMHCRVREILQRENIDLVYVKRKRMAQYAENLNGVKKILDLTDCMALLYERSLSVIPKRQYPLHWMEARKLAGYEPKMAGKFDKVVVCSAIDKDYLEMLAGKKLENVAVVPNVVDLEYYKPGGIAEEENSILFSGIMHAFVNIDAAKFFAKEIFPLVLEKVPDAKFYIVGPEPPASVKSLSSENIVITGKVSELRESIERASIIVVPLRCGAGTKNKILQALALNRAVVSTSLGNEGLQLLNNKHLLIADSPQEFALHVIELLKNRELRKRLGSNGRKKVAQRYSLKALEDSLNKVLVF